VRGISPSLVRGVSSSRAAIREPVLSGFCRRLIVSDVALAVSEPEAVAVHLEYLNSCRNRDGRTLRLPVLVDLEDTEDSVFALSGLRARKDRTAKNRIVLLQDDLRWYERRLPEILREDSYDSDSEN
jgi:hypothetical protein